MGHLQDDGERPEDARQNHALRAAIEIMAVWHGSGALAFAQHKVDSTIGNERKKWVQIVAVLARKAKP